MQAAISNFMGHSDRHRLHFRYIQPARAIAVLGQYPSRRQASLVPKGQQLSRAMLVTFAATRGIINGLHGVTNHIVA